MTGALLNWLGVGADRRRLDAERILVISPHLDDGVFSLGASLRYAARKGADVTVLTVFAGDPASTAPAGWWDAQGGFRTAGEAATARRAEDAAACRHLAATPCWLPLPDLQYGPPGEAAVTTALLPYLRWEGLTLSPGFPLEHDDHALVNHIVREHRPNSAPLFLYAEQPYLLWEATDAGHGWSRPGATVADRVAKLRACRAYASQIAIMGRRDLALQLARFEAARGGELVRPAD